MKQIRIFKRWWRLSQCCCNLPCWQILMCFNIWQNIDIQKEQVAVLSRDLLSLKSNYFTRVLLLLLLLSHFSHVWLSATPQTVAHHAPLSTWFLKQEYWSGLSFSPPGDFPDSGIKPESLPLAGRFFTTSVTWEGNIAKHSISSEFCQIFNNIYHLGTFFWTLVI